MPSAASTSRGSGGGAPPLGAHSAVVHLDSPAGPGGRMGLTEQELANIHNARWLEAVIHWLSGFRNDTLDFSRPQLRLGIEPLWALFVVMYGLVVVLGLIVNVLAVARMWRSPAGRGPRTTVRLLTNICIANVLQCAVVLPLSAIVLMVQNWLYGPVMCYILPMIQDIPHHVQMLTFSAIGYDRYRYHRNPAASAMSPKVVSISLWVVACLIVLPYPVYTTYLDLGSLIRDQLHGVGICILNLAEDMQTYVFVAIAFVFVAPLLLSVYFHGRVWCLLQRQATSSTSRLRMYEERLRAASLQLQLTDPRFPGSGPPSCSAAGPLFALTGPGGPGGPGPRGDGGGSLHLDAEADLFREQRTQRYLITCNAIFVACLLPITALRMAKHRVQETYANSGQLDVLFCIIVFIAFLPAVVVPVLITFWTSSL